MRIAFLTLGCKVNSYETERMKKLFEDAGHMIVAFEEKADVYIVNTCTVTNIADRKSRKMLHRAKRLNPDSLIVAAGCYVDSAEKKGEKDESVDLFISNKNKSEIVDIVSRKVQEKGIKNIFRHENNLKALRSEAVMKQEHTRAYIKVQNGCNQYCTYCIIPYVRGDLKSKSVPDVIGEVEEFAANGVQEVVITGIHVSSYGVDTNKSGDFLAMEGRPLLELLEAVSHVEGIERIRLSSLEPRIISENFAKRLARIPQLCPHFHLSLQSGCDAVLKRMNRHYTTEEYLDKLKILRKYFKNPAVTTDIIVGFPGETDEEFKTTCEFAEKAMFAQIHVFKYSRRYGTIADKMDGQIEETVKSQRSDILLKLEKELEKQYQKIASGEYEEVLLEEVTDINGGKYIVGYNERYIRIAVSADEISDTGQRFNTIATVRIIGNLTDEILLGELR